MSLERFTKEQADQTVAALSAAKGVTAFVVAPSPADDYYAVRATLARKGASVSDTYAWATSAADIVSHLDRVLDMQSCAKKTSKRFLRAERGNK